MHDFSAAHIRLLEIIMHKAKQAIRKAKQEIIIYKAKQAFRGLLRV
jgi:hypothetical protein